jgi:hypothetical protein
MLVDVFQGLWDTCIPAIQSQNIDQVQLCFACKIYVLISFSMCHVLPNGEYNSKRADSARVKAQAFSCRDG